MYSITLLKLLGILAFLIVILSASSCDDMMTFSSGTPSCGFADYRCIARVDATQAGISAVYFERQIAMESGFNPYAISPMGAVGIAQIMPRTAASWGVNPRDPVASLKVASEHMSWYQTTYGSYEKALGCYNAGCSTVIWASSHCGYWLYCMPLETQRYVRNIVY